MTAFTATNQANLRRWAISGAVVVLVHGAIAAAVVTWRNIIVPWQPPGPVVIDLAPAPVPPAEQAALPPAPAQVPSAVPPDKSLDKAQEKTAARGKEKEPNQSEKSPGAAAPSALAPPEGREQENGAAASGGAIHQAVPPGEGAGGPIDTRIGEQPRSRKAGKANDWTKAIMGRPSKTPMRTFAGRHFGPGAASNLARNSIGTLTQDIMGEASAKASNAAVGVKNAVGIAPTNSNQEMARSAGATRNAIGTTIPNRTNSPKTNVGQHKSAVMLASSTTPNATINGTSMVVRPGSGTAMIGGPAKTISGIINGTGIRPK